MGHLSHVRGSGVVDRTASDPYGLRDVAAAREFGRVATHLGLSNITGVEASVDLATTE
jgi:hypothetical protein